MFQFYFQIIYLFYFIICQSPHLSGGGETHYKMCRRRERARERQHKWGGASRSAVSGLSCILFALFTEQSVGGLPKGEMFYYTLSLKSMTNCAPVFLSLLIHATHVHPSPSAPFSSDPCLSTTPSVSQLSLSGLGSEACSGLWGVRV